jgi:hypothetical protein
MAAKPKSPHATWRRTFSRSFAISSAVFGGGPAKGWRHSANRGFDVFDLPGSDGKDLTVVVDAGD